MTSLISAYYYLRVVVIMYMREGDPVAERPALLRWTTAITAVATVALGIVSAPLFRWASQAVLKMF
ncbi:hypothetical protein D6779_09710 [Candidatus Parcubacteria bacterium]|nr:MAG: hypothetical protein D6779_09710 [Candidatus Parcubacteria bacterium]